LAALLFVPWNLRIEGKGELVPKIRRSIYAPVTGVVEAVLVEHGQKVSKDSELLVMANPSLSAELLRLEGERDARRRSARAMREAREIRDGSARAKGRSDPEQSNSRLTEVEAEILYTEKQIEEMRRQMNALHLSAPIAGTVLDWKPREKLHRPVQQGEELLEIGQVDKDWVVEVQFPEKAVGLVARAFEGGEQRRLAATVLLSSSPDRVLTGTLVQLSNQAQLVEKDNVVRARVVLDEPLAEADRRSGLEVRVKADCGPHPLGFVLFRELIDVVRSWVFF
jgi:multidrug efflux pump subunit AcrA (membrane-fusion protein)